MTPINWHSVFFLLFALLACGFALAVVVSQHVVRMAFYLVAALGAVAGLYFLAGADFVGALQLLIYVGGTMVLLVFGVMFTGGGVQQALRTTAAQWFAATAGCGLLLGVLVYGALRVDRWTRHDTGGRQPATAPPTTARLGLGLLGVRVDRLEQTDPAERQSASGYLLAFEIISVHLLVVLIGAAYLARPRRPADQRPRRPASTVPGGVSADAPAGTAGEHRE